MGARAIWKAELHLGDETVPVKLYSAVQDRNIHFKLLHEVDEVPLQQRRVNPLTDETVPYEATRRALEAQRDLFVVLDEDELASAEPEPSRAITVTRFVDPSLINHQWYERPYYLGPDGHEDDYFALAEALAGQNKEGVARWTMRGKGYVGALRAEGAYLMLIALRSADEIIPAAELEPPSGRALAKEELKLAEQLIDALAGEFHPEDFRDEYRHRVKELIEAKLEGKKLPTRKYEPEPAVGSLSASLKASLKKAGLKRAG